MRTVDEIKTAILAKREQDPLRRSQFSFCVGGNHLTFPVSPDEYTRLLTSDLLGEGREDVLFGYSIVIGKVDG